MDLIEDINLANLFIGKNCVRGSVVEVISKDMGLVAFELAGAEKFEKACHKLKLIGLTCPVIGQTQAAET